MAEADGKDTPERTLKPSVNSPPCPLPNSTESAWDKASDRRGAGRGAEARRGKAGASKDIAQNQ